jgi:autotransporter-associated beta strand protein
VSNNLALQDSALNTSGSGGVVLTSTVTTPTLGGLLGSKNLASVIASGYGSVTALTLNPVAGAADSYSGAIANGAAGMNLVKTGPGTQILAGANSYTGTTMIKAGTPAPSASTSMAMASRGPPPFPARPPA